MKRWIAHPRPRAIVPAALTTLIMILAAQATLADAPRVAAPAAKPASTRSQAKKPRAAATHPKPARPTGGMTVRASGMRAAIDPATGRLVRPTAEQIQALDAQAGARRAADDDPSRAVPVIRLADGTELAHLDGRFQEFEVARVGADGKILRSCVQGADAAAKVRADAKVAAAKPAREVQ